MLVYCVFIVLRVPWLLMLVKHTLIDICAGSRFLMMVHCVFIVFGAGSKGFDSCKTHVHCLPCGFQGF